MAINFPDSPSTNDTHTVGDKTWTWNGTYWHLNQNSSTYYAQDGVPSDASGGDFWFESDTGQLFVRYDSAWVEIGHATDFGSSMSDADGDTLIQMEQASDEDIIRFDTAGTERMTIAANGAVDVAGTLTAGAFSGPLTGNVTGNASGTANTVTNATQSAITLLGTLSSATISGDLTVGTSNAQILGPASGAASAGNVSFSFKDDTDTGFYRTDANKFEAATAGVSRMTWAADGKVGIGTSSPETPLHIVAANTLGSTFTGTTRGEGLLVEQSNYSAGNYVSLLESSYDDSRSNPHVRIGAMFDGGGAHLAFGTSNNYGNGITNTAIFIDEVGKVGIGDATLHSYTTWGTPRLQVHGPVHIKNWTGTPSSSTELFDWPHSLLHITTKSDYAWARLQSWGYSDDEPYNTSFDAMWNLGILQNSTLSQTVSNSGTDLKFAGPGAFAIRCGGDERFKITNAGNVGIGTTTPQTRLQVRSAAAGSAGVQEALRVQGTWGAAGDGPLIRFTNYHGSGDNPNALEYNLGGIQGVDFGANWGGGLSFQTPPSGDSGGGTLVERMVIREGGYVGIGHDAPVLPLDVAGGGADDQGAVIRRRLMVRHVDGKSWDDAGLANSGDLYFNYARSSSLWINAGGSGSTYIREEALTGNAMVITGGKVGYSTSRAALKDNVRNVTGAVDLVKQMRPVRFNFKPSAIGDGTNEMVAYDERVGFIAEEMADISHEFATWAWFGDDDKPLMVDNNGGPSQPPLEEAEPIGWESGAVASITVAALKELIARVEALESA